MVATQLINNWALGGMTSRPASLSGLRLMIDVIFMFRHRVSGLVNKMFMRVDVTDLYPFQVSPIQPFFEAT